MPSFEGRYAYTIEDSALDAPAGIRRGATRIELPDHQYMAIRVRKVKS